MDYNFETILVTRAGKKQDVAHIQLNRPKQGNAMSTTFFKEYRECFEKLSKDYSYRVVVVSANGRHFSVGLDLKGESLAEDAEQDVARRAYGMYNRLVDIQHGFSGAEKCPQPVIVCMHGACVGGPIDLACAADIRMCSKDAWFTVKEVDIGLAADLGTLQRLEKVIGSASLVRELCYTARKMQSSEAKACGFVSSVFDTKEEMVNSAIQMAETIASKSPVAVMSTKMNLNFSREHSTSDSLNYQAIWNASMLQSKDVMKAAMASFMKQDSPEFSKL